jgi:hypothetical protein
MECEHQTVDLFSSTTYLQILLFIFTPIAMARTLAVTIVVCGTGGNAKTIMVAAVGPADYNYDESISTLRYDNQEMAPSHVVELGRETLFIHSRHSSEYGAVRT